MVKQFGGLNLFCVPIAKRTDSVRNNKPFFHINSGSSTCYSVKGILHSTIINTNSLITVMLRC